ERFERRERGLGAGDDLRLRFLQVAMVGERDAVDRRERARVDADRAGPGGAQITSSSLGRDAATAARAAACSRSSATSRSPTLSSALRDGAPKPSSRAAAARSSGSDEPASAALPSGQKRAASEATRAKRSAARTKGCA